MHLECARHMRGWGAFLQGILEFAGPGLGPSRIMLGRSLLAPWPAVVAPVQWPAGFQPIESGAVRERLRRHVPAAGRAPPWQDIEADTGAATFARLAGWLAAALQNAVGSRVADFGCADGLDGVPHGIAGYEDGIVGRAALMIAGRLVAAALDPAWCGPSPALRGAVANVLDLGRRGQRDHNTRVLMERATLRNIPAYRVLDDHLVLQLGQGARQHHFLQVMGSRFEHVGSLLCEKDRANAVLRRIGAPVAVQRRVASVEAAQRAARELGGRVVVKPAAGHGGVGVTVGVCEADDIARAFRTAEAANVGAVLVESFIAGDDHRLVVLDGKLVAAARRVPGHVVGDGVHTVAELVAILNSDPVRGEGDESDLVRIRLDDEADRVLASHGHDQTSVPAPGATVFLRATANISTGGTAEDVLDRVHPDVRRLAEVVARAFRLEIMGVDYLTTDIGRAPHEVGGAICEVNRSPGLRPQAQPASIRAGIFDALLDRYFGRAGTGRIPVAVVTGTSGKTTTCRMVAAMLEASGAVTGLAGSDGVTVGGRVLRRGDSAGAVRAQMPLFDPTTEAAVLEVARGGILRYGLPVDAADVVAVLNVGRDHLGQDGAATVADIARAKALTLDVATRHVVLNADDPHCRAMAARAPVPIIWVGMSPENPTIAAHLSEGGTAIHLRGAGDDREVVIASRVGCTVVAPVAAISSTLGGIVAANIRNALAAVAVGHALGLPGDTIAAGLRAMTSAFESNPGRFNLLRAGAVPVLVDSPSCVNDVEALRAVVDRLPALRPRSVAIAHAGDYPDDNLARFAAAFAGGFDRYVCYDWEELRGRRPGEAAALLGAALVAAGVDPGRVAVIPDEREALRESVAMAGDGGLAVLVMQDETDPMRAVLAATGIDGWNFESVAAWLGRAGAPLVNDGALG
jgi:cyanophycin synthetase